MFGTPAPSAAALGSASTPSLAPGFGSSLFSTTPVQQQGLFPQQQQPQQSPFGFPTQFAPSPQLTTQMAPVAPLHFSVSDRDIQAIVDAYKEDITNPKYAFKHLLFSVTDPAARGKPINVPDIMWQEAMRKLEGMETADRERLWPELVQGFKDLSRRLQLQDQVIVSDTERLQMTQKNVKMLQCHFQADTVPRIERMRQKEQGLQRRLLRVMRVIEALEGRGYKVPLVKAEAELAERLTTLARQLKGSGADLTRRVQSLFSISRVHASAGGFWSSFNLPGFAKIDEKSLAYMKEVLQQQTDAIVRLGNVLKRDIRNMEIIMSEDANVAGKTS